MLPLLRSTLALGALLGLLAWLPGCSIATPLTWTAAPAEQPAELHVSVTHAVLDPERRSAFDAGTEALFERLPDQPGLLGYSRRKELFGDEAWTMTVWRDEASHAAFVRSAPHREAMRAGRAALAGARFVEFTWPRASGKLTWRAALDALSAVPLQDYRAEPEAR